MRLDEPYTIICPACGKKMKRLTSRKIKRCSGCAHAIKFDNEGKVIK